MYIRLGCVGYIGLKVNCINTLLLRYIDAWIEKLANLTMF